MKKFPLGWYIDEKNRMASILRGAGFQADSHTILELLQARREYVDSAGLPSVSFFTFPETVVERLANANRKKSGKAS